MTLHEVSVDQETKFDIIIIEYRIESYFKINTYYNLQQKTKMGGSRNTKIKFRSQPTGFY